MQNGTLDQYFPSFNVGISPPNTKNMMKNFYREELDQLMLEKQKQKEKSRQQKLKQRQQFNQRLKRYDEMEQLKDLSYKNYYQMLMQSENRNVDEKVTQNIRDQAKKQLIEKHNQFDVARNIQMEMKIRDRQMKQSYKQQLTRQMQDKRRTKSLQRNRQEQQGQIIRNLSRVDQYEQNKRKIDQIRYKQSLDKATQQKQRAAKSLLHHRNTKNQFNLDQYSLHNPLNNPMPYNIQNPYILRQMSQSLSKNNSYLAYLAGGNISQ